MTAQKAKRPLQAGLVAVLERLDNADMEIETHFGQIAELASKAPGFLYIELFQPLETAATYSMLTYWISQEDFMTWFSTYTTDSERKIEIYQVILSSDFEEVKPLA